MLREPEYLQWVRQQPCAMLGHGECLGAMHAHHPTGRKGMGTKRADSEAYALCTKHHTERHALSGPFKNWKKRDVRDYEAAQSQALREEFLGLGRTDTF